MPSQPVLSTLRLNRALLARQLLLRRRRISPLGAVEHLVGIQSQSPRAAYVGLWARVSRFRPEALERLILERSVVRIALMRSTIHLVSAQDCLALRDIVQPAISRASRHTAARRAAGVERRRARTRRPRAHRRRAADVPELGALLASGGRRATPMRSRWGCARLVPLVQVPPRGLWHRGGVRPRRRRDVAQRGRAVRLSMADLVRRYLAAYGPATVLDAQTFTGLTGLREVFDAACRPELGTFRDEDGGELFDVPGAPCPRDARHAPAAVPPGVRQHPALARAPRAHPPGGDDVAARARERASTGVPRRRLRGRDVEAPSPPAARRRSR